MSCLYKLFCHPHYIFSVIWCPDYLSTLISYYILCPFHFRYTAFTILQMDHACSHPRVMQLPALCLQCFVLCVCVVAPLFLQGFAHMLLEKLPCQALAVGSQLHNCLLCSPWTAGNECRILFLVAMQLCSTKGGIHARLLTAGRRSHSVYGSDSISGRGTHGQGGGSSMPQAVMISAVTAGTVCGSWGPQDSNECGFQEPLSKSTGWRWHLYYDRVL